MYNVMLHFSLRGHKSSAPQQKIFFVEQHSVSAGMVVKLGLDGVSGVRFFGMMTVKGEAVIHKRRI